MSHVPGPMILLPWIDIGRAAAVPTGKTVSAWPSSMTRCVPWPLRTASRLSPSAACRSRVQSKPRQAKACLQPVLYGIDTRLVEGARLDGRQGAQVGEIAFLLARQVVQECGGREC